MSMPLKRLVPAVVALCLSSGAALADRIDGDWCSPANATMTIDGSQVVVPSGKAITGQYNRHHFDYVVPEGDDAAGAHVHADLIDEEEMIVTVTPPSATAPGAPVLWKRCKVTS